MYDLANIPDVTQVVVTQRGQTVLDQVFALPIESIVLVHGHNITATVLHRTGSNGWLLTRSYGFTQSPYKESYSLRKHLETTYAGATFTVLREGGNL